MRQRSTPVRLRSAVPAAIVLALVAATLSSALAVPASAAPAWSPRRLPGAGAGSEALDVNSRGAAVGYATDPAGEQVPVVWSGGRRRRVPGVAAGVARGINRHGLVVGVDRSPGLDTDYGFAARRGVLESLWSRTGYAWGAASVSDRGLVVGYGDDEDCDHELVLWRGGTTIGHHNDVAPGEACGPRPHDVNTHGAVVGVMGFGDVDGDGWGDDRAFIKRPGRGFVELGTLGGRQSHANGVDDRGAVVGRAQTRGGAWHAVWWRGTARRDLGTLGGPTSEATDINRHGQIVGWSTTADRGGRRGWIRTGGRTIVLRPLPGHRASGATAISDAGHVVGWSLDRQGDRHAVIWR